MFERVQFIFTGRREKREGGRQKAEGRREIISVLLLIFVFFGENIPRRFIENGYAIYCLATANVTNLANYYRTFGANLKDYSV